MVCQGALAKYLRPLFGQKGEIRCIFLGKKVIIITFKHGTTIFFPMTIFFQEASRKIGPKSARKYEASLPDRAYDPQASYNTP